MAGGGRRRAPPGPSSRSAPGTLLGRRPDGGGLQKRETGGPEALTILRNMSEAKSRASPELLRRSAQVAWYQATWYLNVAVGRGPNGSGGETLLRPSSPHLTEQDGNTPDLSDVLCVDRESPAFSRLPPR